jgi:hypothetical protein
MNCVHRSTQLWLEHFRRNQATLLPIPWNRGRDLSELERSTISTSIQSFQLGESSEGRHLLRYAREWAVRSGDAGYVEAIRSLIGEEGRHARDLGRFMDMNGIPRLRRGWTDSVFRKLRNVVGTLEISIGVLVTAEIIAKVYYPALRRASGSNLLKAICDQIIRDEQKHVEFQTEQLVRLRVGRPRALMRLTLLLHSMLFVGTVAIVGWSHRLVLSGGGLSIRDFWTACMAEFERDLASMDPRRNPLLSARSEKPLQHEQRSGSIRIFLRTLVSWW